MCYICDTDVRDNTVSALWEGPGSEEAFSTIVNLIKSPKPQKLRRPRVAAMLALKRLLSHIVKGEHLDLTASAFGQWSLQALNSSLRELRIAAGSVVQRCLGKLILTSDRRTLPVFMQGALSPSIVLKNQRVVLDFLRTLSDQNNLVLQETCILAWGQIARYVRTPSNCLLVLIK